MLGLPVRNLMCCCYLYWRISLYSNVNIDGDVLLASPEKSEAVLNLVLLFEISYGNLSKNSFGVCLPGCFPV